MQKLEFCTCFARENMKKVPSKQDTLAKLEKFSLLLKMPGLPRQLKTDITFSMLPILGTNLCSAHCWLVGLY